MSLRCSSERYGFIGPDPWRARRVTATRPWPYLTSLEGVAAFVPPHSLQANLNFCRLHSVLGGRPVHSPPMSRDDAATEALELDCSTKHDRASLGASGNLDSSALHHSSS
jgi:hypothetical protein